jgi:hypothetical protein
LPVVRAKHLQGRCEHLLGEWHWPLRAARGVVGTVGACEVALADEPPLAPAPCSVTTFKLVTMMNWYMNWYMLRGLLLGKVDQVIA